MDEIQHQFEPQIASLNDRFKRVLDGLSDDELKKDTVSAEVKQQQKSWEN